MPPKKRGRKRKAEAIESTSSEPVETAPPSTANPTWGEVTKLLVGPDNVEFLIHKNLLIERSPFFAAKSKQCWSNSSRDIDLSHISVEGFERVVAWIYGNTSLLSTVRESTNSDPLPELRTTFIQAYKSADQLLMVDMQDKLLDDLKRLRVNGARLTHHDLAAACKHEIVHTPYYKFVLKSLTFRFMKDDFTDGRLERFNEGLEYLMPYPDALKDWSAHVAMWRNKPWSDPRISLDCEFHLHGKEGKCYLQTANVNSTNLGRVQIGKLANSPLPVTPTTTFGR